MKKSLGARTLLPSAPVWVVGTYDAVGRPNVMTASWAGICCSKPPCVTVSLRRATHTYACIEARKAYTVSVPSVAHIREVDFLGTVSGATVDKFTATGLTPVRSELVDAPYVAEFPFVLECRLLKSVEVGLHTMFVGEILDVKVDEESLGADGRPDPDRLRTFLYLPEARTYHALGGHVADAFAAGSQFKRERD